jgi:hypothetical protein
MAQAFMPTKQGMPDDLLPQAPRHDSKLPERDNCMWTWP